LFLPLIPFLSNIRCFKNISEYKLQNMEGGSVNPLLEE
jgi:hypothetical protein